MTRDQLNAFAEREGLPYTTEEQYRKSHGGGEGGMTTHRVGEGGAVAKRMSAEERAEAWLKVVLTERRQVRSLTTIRSLASQFRSAEVEAAEEMRERVVGVLFACWCDDYGGMTKDEAANTSEVRLIRSLSSSPREGGK